MFKKILWALLALVLALAAFLYYALGTDDLPATSSFSLDISEIRRLAQARPGELPTTINSLVVEASAFPKGIVVARESLFNTYSSVGASFQIQYPQGSIIIDAATPFGTPIEGTAERLMQAMLAAEAILITHTHEDHIGIIKKSEHLTQLLEKLVLTREQYEEPRSGINGFPEGSMDNYQPLTYQGRYYAFAPGVVLIKAPGHTTGGQFIFVRLQNGEEYLFVGDAVWNMANIYTLTGRPRGIGSMLIGGDQVLVGHQIRALYDLLSTDIHIVVSHDGDQLERQIDDGLIGADFE